MQKSDHNWNIEDEEFGTTMYLREPWSHEALQAAKSHNVRRLILSVGWTGDNLSFLLELPDLKGLAVTSKELVQDTEISALHKLEWLRLNTTCLNSLDLLTFHNLKFLSIDANTAGRFGLSYLHPGVEILTIWGYRGKDLSEFSRMDSLKTLWLNGPHIVNVGGFESRSTVKALHLYGPTKLVSLCEIDRLQNLERLEVDGSSRKLHGHESIGDLPELRYLLLNVHNVHSIVFLSKLNKLERLFLDGYGTSITNVRDGNLKPILRLPSLKRVSFKDRPHYNLKLDDFQALNDQYARETNRL